MRAAFIVNPLVLAASLLLVAGVPGRAATGDLPNDYPTTARADYVLGCMAANQQTRVALERCSCSIDIIASILPYDKYEEAETILSMRQANSMQAREFNAVKSLSDIVANLRRAQAEAEIRCFR